MSKINRWEIDLKKQVNIIIGIEYGKTTFLVKLYSEISFNPDWPEIIHNNGSYGVGFVPCDTPLYEGLSEGQSRLKFINTVLNCILKYDGPQLLIIDNIEKGLHIDVQRTLINDLLHNKPNLKIVCSTHSPTIWYQSWIDYVVRANE
jgi:hypothetical protein